MSNANALRLVRTGPRPSDFRLIRAVPTSDAQFADARAERQRTLDARLRAIEIATDGILRKLRTIRTGDSIERAPLDPWGAHPISKAEPVDLGRRYTGLGDLGPGRSVDMDELAKWLMGALSEAERTELAGKISSKAGEADRITSQQRETGYESGARTRGAGVLQTNDFMGSNRAIESMKRAMSAASERIFGIRP